MPHLICPKCRKRFPASQALGGGWQRTRKVLGCPHCRTFFARGPYADILGLVLGLANLLVATPYLLYQVVVWGNSRLLPNVALALTIGAWLVLGNRYLFKANVRGEAPIYTPPWERS